MTTSTLFGGRGFLGLFFLISSTTLALSAYASDEFGKPDKLPIPNEMAKAIERDMGWSPEQFERIVKAELAADELIERAEAQLGSGYAGSWIEHGKDGSTRVVIASSSSSASRAAAQLSFGAEIAELEIRPARYSLAQLEQAAESFNAAVANPLSKQLSGVHSWVVDVKSNRVVVRVAPGVSDRALDFFAKNRIDLDMIDFQVTDYTPSTLVDIVGGWRYNGCSIGFSVTSGSTKGFVTAGHCGSVGTTVSIGGVAVGQFQESDFPGADSAWANVRPQDTLFNLVWVYSGNSVYAVTNSNSAAIGATVCRSGYRTGWRCGSITQNNVTVNYSSGTVFNLRESNACAGQGDSGGSWVASGNAAQGVTSGGALGSGGTNCGIPQSQRRTWFQQLNPMLSAYGLTLVTN